MVEDAETPTVKGSSLSRGPALLLGTILLAAGLYFIYKQHFFPKFSNFPNGNAPVRGKVLFGIFGANGWTGMVTAVAGGLLLFGAAEHFLAKTMSLIVAVALGAAAIIALVSGNVLGLAAANHLTELGWGVAAVVLFFNTLAPRRRVPVAAGAGAGRVARDRAVAEDERGTRRHSRAGTAVAAGAAGAGAGALAEHEHDRHRAEREGEPVARHDAEGRGAAADPGVADHRASTGTAASGEEPVSDREAGVPAERGSVAGEPGADQPQSEYATEAQNRE